MTSLTRTVLVSTVAAAGSASMAAGGHYDAWWACVDDCCLECPDCVDACTDDFNSNQGNNGSEHPEFDPNAGYIDGTPTIFYQWGETVELRVGRYIGEELQYDPADVLAAKFYVIPFSVLQTAADFENAPWQALPDGEFESVSGMWKTQWHTSAFPDGPYVLRAEFQKPTHLVKGGVNVAFEGTYCAADCDGSGDLNVLDFVCFQSMFVAGDMGADCDGNGVLNVLDFVCYQQQFLAGCE